MKNISVNDEISAPINKGDVLGSVEIALDGEKIGEVNLVADREISKKGFGSLFTYISEKWFNVLR